jgi:predicted nucleic acid-binding protein
MRELVLDASVLAKWFHTEQETGLNAALDLMNEYEAGELIVVVPPLLHLELLNLARRSWAATESQLVEFTRTMLDYRFAVQQPDLVAVARWTARGLTAYDACYVALAEERRTAVVTADRQMLSVAGALAMALV